MKVTMKETYQGVGHSATLLHEGVRVTVFENGENYEVDATLAAWLIENGKAVAYDPPHYGGQAEPEQPRNDEKIYEELAAASAQEENVMTTSNVKKPRKGKGG